MRDQSLFLHVGPRSSSSVRAIGNMRKQMAMDGFKSETKNIDAGLTRPRGLSASRLGAFSIADSSLAELREGSS